MDERIDGVAAGADDVRAAELDAETLALMKDVLRDVKLASERLAEAAQSATDMLVSTGSLPRIDIPAPSVPAEAAPIEPTEAPPAALTAEPPHTRSAPIYFTTTISNIPPSQTPCPPQHIPVEGELGAPRTPFFTDKPVTIDDAKDFSSLAERPREGIPKAPFVTVMLGGLGLSAYTTWLTAGLPVDTALADSEAYPTLIVAAAVLVGLSLFLVLPVWLVARTEVDDRPGLLTRILFRSSVAAAVSVALWLATLVVGDLIRLGRIVF